MAITFARLQELLKKEDLRFFVAPDAPIIQFGIAGFFGRYDITIRLFDDGRFLQFRTAHYHTCPADHPHLTTILKVIGQVNYEKRLLKLGWDPADGEIMAYADIWLMDNDLTQEQFHRMMGNYMPELDLANLRLQKVIETGVDPGEPDIGALAKQAAGGGGPKMPPALKDLLEKLRGGRKPEEGQGDDDKKVTEV